MVATVNVFFDFGGTSGVHATQTLTITGQPSDTQTVTLDTNVYTFQTTLTNVDGNVQIGGSASARSGRNSLTFAAAFSRRVRRVR